MSVVLYQEEMGVYLGSFLGMGIWSKLDPAGQDHAAVFKDSLQATEIIKVWDSIPEGIRAVPVDVPDDEHYASMATCVASGLPAWDTSYE